MMNKEELKRRAFAAIDAHAQELMDFGQDIFCHPELGYKETRTAEKVLQAFAKLGISETTRPALTGVKGWLFQKGGPRVAVMGELDAVPVSYTHLDVYKRQTIHSTQPSSMTEAVRSK